MKEIQGKLTLVRVSVRFELARVRVIGISKSFSALENMERGEGWEIF